MSRTKRSPKRRKRNVLQVAVQQKKRQQYSSGKLFLWGGGAAVIGLLGLGFYIALEKIVTKVIYESPDFAITKIEIDHAGALTEREIRQWSGLKPGQSLVKTDLTRVCQNLLAVPTISEVKARRLLPGTVLLQVRERLPVARVVPYSRQFNTLAQSVYYVDADGFIMKPKEGEKLKPLPEITGIPADEIMVGEKIEHQAVYSALTLLRAADYYGLKSDLDLDRIEVQKKGYLIVRTQMQGLIRFRTHFIDQQIKRLQYVMTDSRSTRRVVRTVDMTPERNVAVTYF
ncbi:MAG: FtsQ-type POTRA domain-containing protein [Verrucomicrobiota bacterium]